MAAKTKLQNIARYVRSLILSSTTAAGSGHPTSSLSAVELATALFFGGTFRARLHDPFFQNNDRFILSKGHAAPLLYALYTAAGVVNEQKLLHLRAFGSELEGHPTPLFSYTEVPTGSLGQGLSAGVGMALHAQMHKLSFRTFVLLGDSEMAEGSNWEAIQFAGFRKLSGLVAILDCNRLGQSGPTMLGWKTDEYAQRIRAFGWNTIVVDGHSVEHILTAYKKAAASIKPTCIIAKTIKGKGVSFVENKQGWHGKALSAEELHLALAELGNPKPVRGHITPPKAVIHKQAKPKKAAQPRYEKGSVTAPRKALGNALVRLSGQFPDMIVLDGDVQNSTYTETFAQKVPQRFIECFIAEQNMAGIAQGLAARGSLPVAATFAAFWTRAHDQLRMASYAGTHQVFAGTHAGVSIGRDGASQMGLEDIAMFRALHNSTILYPADAYATERLTECALAGKGIQYLRITRAEQAMLYNKKTKFRIGGSHTLLRSRHDIITLVAAGVTVHEALQAARMLRNHHIHVRVIDCYSVKPLDVATLRKAAHQTKTVVVVEDHRPEGGIAEAVRSALGTDAGKVHSLAVTKIPHSGKPEQLLAYEGIDAEAIVGEVRKVGKV